VLKVSAVKASVAAKRPRVKASVGKASVEKESPVVKKPKVKASAAKVNAAAPKAVTSSC
jgi:hypothetical protein